MKKIISISLLICIFTLCLTACGGKKGVPDNFAMEAVGECSYITYKYPSSTKVIHNRYDSESYLDYVTIVSKSEGKYGYYISTCDAVFQYNRTSGTWSLFRANEWTNPAYTFNSNLLGNYNVPGEYESENLDLNIEISSVTENEIQLNYDLSANVDYRYIMFKELHIESSGKETLENGKFFAYSGDSNPHITLDIKLPEGYKSDWGDGDFVSLTIEIDLEKGIKSANLLGFIVAWKTNP